MTERVAFGSDGPGEECGEATLTEASKETKREVHDARRRRKERHSVEPRTIEMIAAAASAGVPSAIGLMTAGMCPKLPVSAACLGFHFPRCKDHSESQQEGPRQENR